MLNEMCVNIDCYINNLLKTEYFSFQPIIKLDNKLLIDLEYNE